MTYDPVGFTAYAVSDANYNSYETVEFTGIISNIGDSYNRNDSSFRCPFRGVYMFSLTVKADSSYYGYFQIMRDGEFIAEAWADSDYHYSTGAALVVIECEAGQNVWVSTGYDYAYIEGGSNRESLFTGYMLYRYE